MTVFLYSLQTICLNLQKIDFFYQLVLQIVPIHFKAQRVCLNETDKSLKISGSIWCSHRSSIICDILTSYLHSVLTYCWFSIGNYFRHALSCLSTLISMDRTERRSITRSVALTISWYFSINSCESFRLVSFECCVKIESMMEFGHVSVEMHTLLAKRYV